MAQSSRGAALDTGLLILRVASGLMMAGHGWGKVTAVVNGNFVFSDPLGIGPAPSLVLAALAEFVCALLVVVGFRTRWAAVPVLVTMLVAGFVHHANDTWFEKEKAFLFAVVFAVLAITGGGRYALDTVIGRGK